MILKALILSVARTHIMLHFIYFHISMVHIKFDNKNVIFQYIILRGINSCYLCQLSQMHPRTLYALNIDLSHVRRTALEDRD